MHFSDSLLHCPKVAKVVCPRPKECAENFGQLLYFGVTSLWQSERVESDSACHHDNALIDSNTVS